MILIDNILVAVNNKKIYKKINKYFNIEFKDIIYKEGILEILINNKNINKIILSDILLGEIKLENLINKIKKINNNIQIIILINNKINIKRKKEKYNINSQNIYSIKEFIKKINKNIFSNKVDIKNKILIIGSNYKEKIFLINKINNIYSNILIITFFYSKKSPQKTYIKKNNTIKFNLANNFNIINKIIKKIELENKYLIYNVNNYFILNKIIKNINNINNIIYLLNNLKEINYIKKNEEKLNIKEINKKYIIINNKLNINKKLIIKILKKEKINKIIKNNKFFKLEKILND